MNHETRADDEKKNNDEDNNVVILMISDEEIQTAINNVKQAEDIRTCDDATKETIKTDLQRSGKARKLHSRNMAQNTDRSYPQKRERRRC